jgi:hypothetical protein
MASMVPRGEPYVMAVSKDNFRIGMDLAGLKPWHAVVHASRQFPDFRMQRAAAGNVHFLKAAADAEQRNRSLKASLDQRQGQRVPPSS